MSKEENLKQLKTALTEHRDVIVCHKNNNWIHLSYRDDNYRGKSYYTGLDIGIWDLEFLFKLANGMVEDYRLKLYE